MLIWERMICAVHYSRYPDNRHLKVVKNINFINGVYCGINMSLDGLDALVIVHPDWTPYWTDETKETKFRQTPEYKAYATNLLNAVNCAQESGKPVFLVCQGGHVGPLEFYLMSKGAHLVDVSCYTSDKSEIESVAIVFDKKPEEIRLGFGGVYADACVINIASSWCRKVEKEFKIKRKYHHTKGNAIGYGRIISEISLLRESV